MSFLSGNNILPVVTLISTQNNNYHLSKIEIMKVCKKKIYHLFEGRDRKIRGGSRISQKGIHMHKGLCVGGRGASLCSFYLISLKYPMKMK